MNARKVFLFIMILFLTGCGSKYSLIISDDQIKETINIDIPKYMIPEPNANEIKYGIELDDQITPFIEKDHYPLYDNYSIIYNKENKESDDYINLKLDHTYTKEEFSNSNVLKSCFDNYAYSYENKYVLKASGNFYCLHHNDSEVEINIKAKNRVIKSNAEKVKGKTHTWYITKENQNNVNIEIEIARGFSFSWVIPYIMIIIAILLLVFFGVKLFNKRKEINKI